MERAGQSKRKWDSFSTWFVVHSLQRRWLLSVLTHRPVSISNLRFPSLNFVKSARFFLEFKDERCGAAVKDRGIFLYKYSFFVLRFQTGHFEGIGPQKIL